MAKYSILHIEDNKADAVLLNIQLQNSPFGDFNVTWTSSLKGALKEIIKCSFDAIVLDLGLPDTVRFEGLTELREACPHIPIVVHTGLDSVEVGIEAISLGAHDFIQKDSVDPNIIGKTINFAIERAKHQRKLSEQKIELDKLDHAIQQSANAIVITDAEGNIEFVNKKFEVITGYSEEEVLGQNPRVLNAGKQSKKFYERMWTRIKSGETWIGYFHNKKKNGELFWERASISAVKNDDGEIINYIAVKEDISELRAAENENLVTTERLTALFDSNQAGIIYVNARGMLQESNAMASEILGFSEYQLADYTYMDEHWKAQHIDGRPYTPEEFPAAVTLKTAKKVSNAIMSVYQPRKKTRIWLSIDTIPLYEMGDDQLTGLYTVFKEITKEFESTIALQQNASKLKLAQEIGNVGYWEWNFGDNGIYWSEEVFKIFEEEPGTKRTSFEEYLKFVLPEDREQLKNAFEHSIKKKEACRISYRIKLKDGKVKHIEDSWIFMDESPLQKSHVIGVIHDVTNYRESEERLVEASKAANLGHWKLDVATERLWWSDQTFEIYGVDRKQNVDVDFYFSLVHPDDLELAQEVFQRGLTETGVIDGQYRILVKGETRYVQVNGKFNFDREGSPLEATGVARDVTELKSAENRLSLASKAANVGIWSYNIIEDSYWISDQVFDIFDVKDQNIEDFNFEYFMSFVFEEDIPVVLKAYEESLNSENGFEYSHRIKTSKGIRYVQYSGQVIKNEAGEPILSTGTVIDITYLKEAENKALENESKLDSILSSMDDMVLVIDDDGNFVEIYSSPTGIQPIVPREKLLGVSYDKVLPYHVADKIDKACELIIKEGGVQELSYHLNEKDNTRSYWEAKLSRLAGPQSGFTVVIRNVTEKHLFEKKLLLSEATYKNHSENLPHILWTADENGKATYLNKIGERFYGMNAKQFRETGWNILHQDSIAMAREKWKKAITKKNRFINTEQHKNAQGEYRWLNVQANPVKDHEGNLIGWVGVSTDVHKEIMTRKENEQLLFELRERVKESSVMYKMTQAIVKHTENLEGLFEEIAEDLKDGFLCPDCTRVKIEYQGDIYGFKKLGFKNRISFPLQVGSQEFGSVEVALATKDKDGKPLDFLKEEYLLMSSVADNLSIAIGNYLTSKGLEANESKYRDIFENLQEGYLLLDTKGEIIEHNPEAAKLLSSNGAALEGQHIESLISQGEISWNDLIRKKIQKNIPLSMHRLDDIDIHTNFNFRKVYQDKKLWLIEATFKDITRTTKFNRLAEYSLKLYASTSKSTADFIQDGIDYAVELLDSKAGFYHFVNEEEGTIKLVQWSMGTKEVCQVPSLVSDYKIKDAGVWVECLKSRQPVVHNDYRALIKKGGLPKGHFPIIRDLEIPIIQEGKAVGILGVGNKETYYDELDKEVLKSYSSLFHSIVQKKQLEDQYLETLRSFQQSQEAAKIGAWTFDIVYDKTWWSDTMYDIYERPKELGVPTENWLDDIHKDDREKLIGAFTSAQETGHYECEYRILIPDGSIKHVYAKSIVYFDADHKPLKHVGILQDITERVETLKLIKEKSTQFESMVESLDGFVYRLMPTGQLVYLSSSFESLTGYTPESYFKEYDTVEEQLRISSQHFHKDDLERAKGVFQNAFEKMEDYSITYRIQKPDGTILWVSDNAKLILDQEGNPMIQGYVTDISDRVRAEEKIMNAVMKASDGEKTRISKEIHDSLQQTLTIAALNLEFVKKDEDQLSDFVKKKYATGWEYLKRSMHDTRAIAHRLMPKAIEDFGLVPVLKDMVDDLNRSSGVQFEFLTNMEGKRIQIPMATNLYKLIQEAINNILKHAKANNVTIQYMGLGDILQLIVEDDGNGFEIDKLDLGKTGFGLASMKSRATALGAEFILDSFPGHGTTLMVEIPYTKEIEYYE